MEEKIIGLEKFFRKGYDTFLYAEGIDTTKSLDQSVVEITDAKALIYWFNEWKGDYENFVIYFEHKKTSINNEDIALLKDLESKGLGRY